MIKDKAKKKEAIEWFTRPDVVKGLGLQELHVYITTANGVRDGVSAGVGNSGPNLITVDPQAVNGCI